MCLFVCVGGRSRNPTLQTSDSVVEIIFDDWLLLLVVFVAVARASFIAIFVIPFPLTVRWFTHTSELFLTPPLIIANYCTCTFEIKRLCGYFRQQQPVSCWQRDDGFVCSTHIWTVLYTYLDGLYIFERFCTHIWTVLYIFGRFCTHIWTVLYKVQNCTVPYELETSNLPTLLLYKAQKSRNS